MDPNVVFYYSLNDVFLMNSLTEFIFGIIFCHSLKKYIVDFDNLNLFIEIALSLNNSLIYANAHRCTLFADMYF